MGIKLSPKILIYVLTIIIFALIVHMIMRQPSTSEEVVPTNTDLYDAKIKKQQEEIILLKIKAEQLERKKKYLISKIDSLASVKSKIKIEYREVYTDISSANNNKLDSLIRANW